MLNQRQCLADATGLLEISSKGTKQQRIGVVENRDDLNKVAHQPRREVDVRPHLD